MSQKLAFTGDIPPELLNAALGLATLGAGGGIASGVVADKPVDSLASDLLSGAMGGAAGGGTLGAGLALLGKGLPAGNILARNPLGMALLMAGGGAGLGAFLKGSKDRPAELPIQMHPALAATKISQETKEARVQIENLQARRQDPPGYAFGNTMNGMGDMASGHGQQLLANQAQMAQRQNAQAAIQAVMARRQRDMAEKQELDRRETMGRNVGGPIGSFLGKHLGSAVSSLAGERPVEGIRGWFGAKERRIDPELAKEVGSTLGNLGGGEFGARLVRRMQKNPTADLYMDQLGL